MAALIEIQDGKVEIQSETIVGIQIKSIAGLFTNSTKFAVDFFLCPLDRSRYNDTTRTFRQNFLNDRKVLKQTDGTVTSEYFGTAYQTFKELSVTVADNFTANIVLTIKFSSEIISYLKTLDDNDRNFALCITTQDVSVTTSEDSSRNTMYVFGQLYYNRDDSSLLVPVDSIRFYHYPDSNFATTGYPAVGQPVRVNFPFKIKATETDGVLPSLMSAGFKIVSIKTGESDFILEEKTFDVSGTQTIDGIQQFDISETRNFIIGDSDFNTNFIKRDESFDSAGYTGFNLQYSFIARYEDWYKLIEKNLPFDFVATQNWRDLQQDGWTLAVRFDAAVRGYDGHITEFYDYAPIVIANDASGYTATVNYFNQYGLESKSLITDEKTLISIRIDGSTIAPAGFDTPYCVLFLDYENTGGQNVRLMACSGSNSESTSPFTAAEPMTDALQVFQSDNATLNVYSDHFILQTWYDDTNTKFGINNLTPYLRVFLTWRRLAEVMIFESSEPMTTEDETVLNFE